MDTFLVGLNDTTLYWMGKIDLRIGNAVRDNSTALCFSEVSMSDTGIASTKHDVVKSPLISSNEIINKKLDLKFQLLKTL
jgi:hypothetical protein